MLILLIIPILLRIFLGISVGYFLGIAINKFFGFKPEASHCFPFVPGTDLIITCLTTFIGMGAGIGGSILFYIKNEL